MARTHITLAELFADIADAIREGEGSSGTIIADTFPERIRAAFKSIWHFPVVVGDHMQLTQAYGATKSDDVLEIE